MRTRFNLHTCVSSKRSFTICRLRSWSTRVLRERAASDVARSTTDLRGQHRGLGRNPFPRREAEARGSPLLAHRKPVVHSSGDAVRTVTRSPTISFDDETRSPNSSARSPSRFHLSLLGGERGQGESRVIGEGSGRGGNGQQGEQRCYRGRGCASSVVHAPARHAMSAHVHAPGAHPVVTTPSHRPPRGMRPQLPSSASKSGSMTCAPGRSRKATEWSESKNRWRKQSNVYAMFRFAICWSSRPPKAPYATTE